MSLSRMDIGRIIPSSPITINASGVISANSDDMRFERMFSNLTKEQEWEDFCKPERPPVNKFKIIQLESPFRGVNYEHTEFNKKYAEACVRECLYREESAMASHLLYTGATDDTIPEERAMGIEAGLKFLEVAEYSVVYIDLGISYGMKQGIKRAKLLGKNIVYRKLQNFDKFLEDNKNLLNGHSHIVGKVKEYTLKDELLNEIHAKIYSEDSPLMVEVAFHNEYFLDNFGDDLSLVYPVASLNSSDFVIYYAKQHEKHYADLVAILDKWKLNKKLKAKLPEKTKIKSNKI